MFCFFLKVMFKAEELHIFDIFLVVSGVMMRLRVRFSANLTRLSYHGTALNCHVNDTPSPFLFLLLC